MATVVNATDALLGRKLILDTTRLAHIALEVIPVHIPQLRNSLFILGISVFDFQPVVRESLKVNASRIVINLYKNLKM